MKKKGVGMIKDDMAPYYLLETPDIDSYLKKRIGKKFVGTYARDMTPEIKKKFDKLKEAYTVLNMDDSEGQGSHWVALGKKTAPDGEEGIFYMDPFGAPPPLEVLRDFDNVYYTPSILQNINRSDCGIWSIFLILQMANNKGDEINFKQYNNMQINLK